MSAKQKRMTGCFRAKATGFHAIGIKDHLHAANRLSATSKTCVVPIAADPLRFDKENVGRNSPLQSRHDLRQLTDTGACAWAMWMCQHHQCRAASCSFDLRGRPGLRERADASGRILVMQDPHAKRHRRGPCDREQ
jgi:hypothetical protein